MGRHLPTQWWTTQSYTLTPALKLQGRLTPNDKLALAEPILEDQITGPESIAVKDGEIFTGLIGGEVIGHKDGVTRKIAKFGKDCDGKIDEAVCGRPLGMRFDSQGRLVVADSYYGVFRVTIGSTKVETLWSSEVAIDGHKPMCPNDLDVSKSGMIYFSDSSTNYHLQDSLQEFIGVPSGRLIRLDPMTNTTTVLMNDLSFANGVQLFPDESAVLVCETARFRIWKVHLTGPKTGTHEIFIDGLPGSPDNIRSNGKGGFFVSLIVPRYADRLSLSDTLGGWPLVRKLLMRVIFVISSSLRTLNYVLPNPLTKTAEYYVGHLEPVGMILPKHGHVLEVDQNGKILSSFQDATGKVSHISEFSIDEQGKTAYLGSPYNTKVWKIDVEKLRREYEEDI